ncbi:MAG: hypothetical protein Q7T54_05620 [Candidatus Levybacteria bacterium]|nr:hypothetical protein [Candidatus Levybacteria bacterium]
MVSIGKRFSSDNSPFLLLGALIVLGLGFIGAMSQRGGGNAPIRQEIPKENQKDLKNDTSSINTLIYGSKGEDISLISAINDSGINNSSVTTIKDTVKFVTPLVTGKHLLYIADTDYGDMGGSFALKQITPAGSDIDGPVRTIYTPTDEYKIDRYVISKDHKWIAWYEVKAADDGGYTHENDFYRVFKANLDEVINGKETLSPSTLLEQKAGPGVAISLPSVITNVGSVYFDTLIPSSYALYYGYKNEALSVILPLNSYNSNPYFFNERYLLYTAFDPNNSRLPSTGDTDSTRDQIVNTNIVKTYDLDSKQIVTVAPGNEGEHYKHPVFVSGVPESDMSIVSEIYRVESVGGKSMLVFSEIQLIKKDKEGNFTKETIVGKSDNTIRILDVGELPSGDKTVLIGEEIAFRGNLGTGNGIGPSGYKNKLKSIKVYNLTTKELITTILPDKSNDFEFVSVMPKLPQEKLGIERNKKLVDELSVTDRQLKLGTFVPVEPKRERKNPRSECETEWEKKGYPNYEACEACPIYAYSSDNKKITISPRTPISKGSAVPQLVNGVWSFETNRDGALRFSEGNYKKIDYDFPRGSVALPSGGVILKSSELQRGIADYAYSLGFNTREVMDIVTFFSRELEGSSYVYFSNLPEKEVENLLAIDVLPKPQAFMSHIFYAKKLSNATDVLVSRPEFKPLVRKDFTVVVWGSVIE